jgi:hypothetical protein
MASVSAPTFLAASAPIQARNPHDSRACTAQNIPAKAIYN